MPNLVLPLFRAYCENQKEAPNQITGTVADQSCCDGLLNANVKMVILVKGNGERVKLGEDG